MPVQENYIAGLIRQKIYVAIDSLPLQRRIEPTFLLYLPEGENQELSLLLIHYLLRHEGYHVINLGQNVSLDDLKDARKIYQPDYVFTLLNMGLMKLPVKEYIEELSLYYRTSQIIVSGVQVSRQQIRSSKNYHILNGLDDIMDFISKIESTPKTGNLHKKS